MQPPKLHDRGSTRLIEEAEGLVPVYVPQWTGASDPHDPGRAMIVLAARLVELLAERVNRVPEKNLLAFLDLVGVERPPGLPAEAPVTFMLSARAESGQQIPAGTQVATTQTEAADAQVFETRSAFFATRAALVQVLNVLPGQDLYGSLTALHLPPKPEELVDPSRAIDILSEAGSGLLPSPHALYLASAALFGRSEPTDVRLDFTIANGQSSVFDPQHLVWQRFNSQSKNWEDLANVSYVNVSGVSATVRFQDFPGTGKSIVAGDEDAWIAGRLKTAPSSLPSLPIISQITGAVATAQAPATAPDAALFNGAPLDLSKPALPFGERPRYGDAFHIGSSKAFGADVASVTIQMQLRGYSGTELVEIFGSIDATTTITTRAEWQYLGPDGVWKALPSAAATHVLTVDKPPAALGNFHQSGNADAPERTLTLFGNLGGNTTVNVTFTVPADMTVGKVGGISSRWIRVLLRSLSPYGRDGFVKVVPPTAPATVPTVTAVGPTFIPPVIESLAIDYAYKTSALPIDRIAIENNFEIAGITPPTVGSGQPLVPFVPLGHYAPSGVSSLTSPSKFLADAAALYVGFDAPFENAFISILIAFVEARDATHLLPETENPHVIWEYLAAGSVWKPLDVLDGTSDLTSTGVVGFQAPIDSLASTLWSLLTKRPLFWYRARLQNGSYTIPPRLSAVVLNTVMADNQQTVPGDFLLGSASGELGQRLTISRTPVLAGDIWVRENEVPSEMELAELIEQLGERSIEEGVEGSRTRDDVVEERSATTLEREVWVRWLRVSNFHVSGPRSRHYTLEAPTGVVTFGNGIEGLVPPIGKDNIVVRGLRAGGGELANAVATALAIKELKSSLASIDSVFNVSGATGGTDPWTLEQTFTLGPQAIKNRGRAVTVEDYEWVTLAAFGQVARAKALPTSAPARGGTLVKRPGAVSVIIVPKGTERTPQPPKGLLRRIEAYLRRRAFAPITGEPSVGTQFLGQIYALPPQYLEVPIEARVRPRNPQDASVVQRRVVRALEDFFHPLTGGEQGQGWPFGRTVYISEIFAVIERTEGVDHVVEAEFVNDPAGGQITVQPNAIVASGDHRITVV